MNCYKKFLILVFVGTQLLQFDFVFAASFHYNSKDVGEFVRERIWKERFYLLQQQGKLMKQKENEEQLLSKNRVFDVKQEVIEKHRAFYAEISYEDITDEQKEETLIKFINFRYLCPQYLSNLFAHAVSQKSSCYTNVEWNIAVENAFDKYNTEYNVKLEQFYFPLYGYERAVLQAIVEGKLSVQPKLVSNLSFIAFEKNKGNSPIGSEQLQGESRGNSPIVSNSSFGALKRSLSNFFDK